MIHVPAQLAFHRRHGDRRRRRVAAPPVVIEVVPRRRVHVADEDGEDFLHQPETVQFHGQAVLEEHVVALPAAAAHREGQGGGQQEAHTVSTPTARVM